MKIASLTWGSVAWDPRNLAVTSNFEPTSPILPIEFCTGLTYIRRAPPKVQTPVRAAVGLRWP